MALNTIRTRHHPILTHEILDVVFAHIERSDTGISFLNDLNRGIDRVLMPGLRNGSESAAVEGSVAGVDDENGFGPAAPFQTFLHVCRQPRANRRIGEAREKRGLTARLGPARNERSFHTCPGCIVRILASSDADAFPTRLANERNHLWTHAPGVFTQCFDMRDVYR